VKRLSYGNIKKSTAHDAGKKFEKFIKMNRANIRRLYRRMWYLYNWKSQGGQQPCPRQQEDAGLAQREPYGGEGGGGLASQLA
jgi:hypothetical protein